MEQVASTTAARDATAAHHRRVRPFWKLQRNFVLARPPRSGVGLQRRERLVVELTGRVQPLVALEIADRVPGLGADRPIGVTDRVAEPIESLLRPSDGRRIDVRASASVTLLPAFVPIRGSLRRALERRQRLLVEPTG